jgi:phosphoglycolate phosphatase
MKKGRLVIKGIIFDKDGTLFDFNATWGAWTRGMLEAEAGT